jgi:hypothetical protein
MKEVCLGRKINNQISIMAHIESLEVFLNEKSALIEEGNKVDQHYDKIIAMIRTSARSLNDDEAYELHERLKKFFERAI